MFHFVSDENLVQRIYKPIVNRFNGDSVGLARRSIIIMMVKIVIIGFEQSCIGTSFRLGNEKKIGINLGKTGYWNLIIVMKQYFFVTIFIVLPANLPMQ